MLSAATQLVFAQSPSGNVAGLSLGTIIVDLEDGSGNIVTADSSTVAVTLNTGVFSTGSNTFSTPAVNGVAMFPNPAINTTGVYTLTASDDVLASAPFIRFFSVTPAAVSQRTSLITVNPATLDVNSSATITLQTRDVFGNNLTTGGLGIAFSLATPGTSGGTIGVVEDNHNGTYPHHVQSLSQRAVPAGDRCENWGERCYVDTADYHGQSLCLGGVDQSY